MLPRETVRFVSPPLPIYPLPQIVHAISHLPAGSTAQSAAATVRALDPRYAGVAAVDSGKVDVLTRLEKGVVEEERAGMAEKVNNRYGRRQEEEAYEQLLFGMEVRAGRGVEWEVIFRGRLCMTDACFWVT